VSGLVDIAAVPGFAGLKAGRVAARYVVLDSPNIPDIGADLRPRLPCDSLGRHSLTHETGH